MVLTRQINYMQQKDLGFDKDQLVALSLDSLSRANINALENVLSEQAFVQSVSGVNQLPVSIRSESAINAGKAHDEASRRLVRVLGTDKNFLKTSGLTLVAGSDFPAVRDPEQWEVLLNESAAVFFGWLPEEAIGKELFIWGHVSKVKGVVSDFHFGSMKETIKPLVMMSNVFTDQGLSHLLIRTNGVQSADVINVLQNRWKEVNPDSPFLLTFMNDRYQMLYESETRLGTMVTVFSMLAIIIAALGLFGLASYTILQRTRELGIRKVLGAQVAQLISLVSLDFIKPVFVAFLLAIPLSYYAMNEWLLMYAYRLPFSWLLVLLAGVITIFLAGIIVTYHSYQIATANPVKSLKEE
jgi:putative ABC transport system permease protein